MLATDTCQITTPGYVHVNKEWPPIRLLSMQDTLQKPCSIAKIVQELPHTSSPLFSSRLHRIRYNFFDVPVAYLPNINATDNPIGFGIRGFNRTNQ